MMVDLNDKNLNDLPRFEAGVNFESLLMSQIEMPQIADVNPRMKWLAPLALAASLVFGVAVGTTNGLNNIMSGLGLADDSATLAENWSGVADPYAVTFASF